MVALLTTDGPPGIFPSDDDVGGDSDDDEVAVVSSVLVLLLLLLMELARSGCCRPTIADAVPAAAAAKPAAPEGFLWTRERTDCNPLVNVEAKADMMKILEIVMFYCMVYGVFVLSYIFF